MHIGLIGFGLIGGSIARAVRSSNAATGWSLAAWSPSGDGPTQAVADGVIDRAAATPAEALADADLVVLAAPPTACLAALDELVGSWHSALPPDAVITDVASTKVAILERADAAGLRFVGGHPMAGLDSSGYAASRPDLFVDRPWVVIPGRVATDPDADRVTALVTACGARVARIAAADHDRAVAGISHLPLIAAAALVEAVAGGVPGSPHRDWPIAAALAAGGWRDMTRLARGDPQMGAGIAATNASAIAERLRDFIAVLERWRVDLERAGGPEEAGVHDRLAALKTRLEEADRQ